MIKDLFRFWYKRDSITAAVLVIDIAQYMNPKDLSQISDYLRGLASDREHQEKQR